MSFIDDVDVSVYEDFGVPDTNKLPVGSTSVSIIWTLSSCSDVNPIVVVKDNEDKSIFCNAPLTDFERLVLTILTEVRFVHPVKDWTPM